MLGPWQIAIIVILVAVLFGGRGKITNIMGDMASGIKAFKKGLAEEDESKKPQSSAALTEDSAQPVELKDKKEVE